jgi:hypothetical protein
LPSHPPVGRSGSTIYNLILKDKALFVAGGFLARGKPPLKDKVESAQPR